ncbi:MAG: hypothetical protein ACRD0J_00235 [Acidimicrobiales bacterium]
MTVYQCPRCVLLFAYKGELEWHLREEHPRDQDQDQDQARVPVPS